jgi:hypothetical protein
MPKSAVESGAQIPSGRGRSGKATEKQRIRRWLSDIDDKRLLSFGLTPEDIALLRGACDSSDFVYLSLLCALSVPSPPGSWF